MLWMLYIVTVSTENVGAKLTSVILLVVHKGGKAGLLRVYKLSPWLNLIGHKDHT